MAYQVNSDIFDPGMNWDEIGQLLEMLNDSTNNTPVAVDTTAENLIQKSQFLKKNTQHSLAQFVDVSDATESNNIAVNQLDVDNAGISKDSTIDFDLLQLYGYKVDQSHEMNAVVPSITDATHSNDIDYASISTNEIDKLLGTLHADGADEYNSLDCTIDEDLLRFLEQIVVEDKLIQNLKSENLNCPICKRQFHVRHLFESHVASHRLLCQFKCNACSEMFVQSKQLIQHIAISHGRGKIYSCYLCKKFFTTTNGLKYHMNLKHTDKSLHYCKVCKIGFATITHLNEHMNMQAKKNSFECNDCSKRFKRLGNLCRHVRNVHEKVTTSKSRNEQTMLGRTCSMCTKEFISKTGLQRHINGVHTKKISYQCTLCEKIYYYRASLRYHYKLKHTHGSKAEQNE